MASTPVGGAPGSAAALPPATATAVTAVTSTTAPHSAFDAAPTATPAGSVLSTAAPLPPAATATPAVAVATTPSAPLGRSLGKMRPPAPVLTRRTLLYLLVVQGLGPGVIDAAINFGIHVAVFNNDKAVHLFPFPNTIAGDMVVTLVVQMVLTWLIVGAIVWNDVRIGLVEPLLPEAVPGGLCAAHAARRGSGPPAGVPAAAPAAAQPPAPYTGPTVPPLTAGGRPARRVTPWGVAEWATTMDDPLRPAGWVAAADAQQAGREGAVAQQWEPLAAAPGVGGTAGSSELAPLPPFPAPPAAAAPLGALPPPRPARGHLRALTANAARGLAWCLPAFLVMWPLSIAICAGIWGDSRYNNFPQAPLIMAVYGGVLGALTTPIAAACALVTAGRWATALGGLPPDGALAAAAAERRAARFSKVPPPAPLPSLGGVVAVGPPLGGAGGGGAGAGGARVLAPTPGAEGAGGG